MTRKQMAFMFAANALISALITVLLVLVILPAFGGPKPAGPLTPTGSVMGQTPQQSGATLTPTPVIHIVQAGDTISALAVKYDVPAEDIIAANSLTNPNYLQQGQKLIIPVGGLPEMTPTFTPEPTATDTPLPIEPPSQQMTATAVAATATSLPTPLPAGGELQIEISEVLGAGDINQEQVIIINRGERLADLLGWTLHDGDGNVFTFPNFRLWPRGSSITIHTRVGQDGNPFGHFYWNKLVAIWSVGEIATLKNDKGETIATYQVGP
ncbi:MAG: LysM peptidoglycan-binding domain-containing protein [Anaerolineae bacterium]